MKYHNVYYYCGILNNVIEYQQEEFLTKLWEFSHVYLEKVPEKYDKESVLLLFLQVGSKINNGRRYGRRVGRTKTTN